VDSGPTGSGSASGKALGIEEMRATSGALWDQIVRLEPLAEGLISEDTPSGDFAQRFVDRLNVAVAAGAVGTKSIAAYRFGLDLPAQRPSPGEVTRAVSSWHKTAAETGKVRAGDPVVLSHLIWSALDVGLPLQLHIGYGDPDLDLVRGNPLLLTQLIRNAEALGTPIMLLHCWPFHREAGYLAQMFPHIYFDVGLAINYLGVQSVQLIREAFEVGPFTKQLFSSDAWGPAELHYLGARLWRRAMTKVLAGWVEEGDWGLADAVRAAAMIGRGNAQRVYRLHD
jgi:hypothetical protein